MLTNLQELDLSMNSFQHVPDQCTWRDGHLATSLTKLSINQNILSIITEGEVERVKKMANRSDDASGYVVLDWKWRAGKALQHT